MAAQGQLNAARGVLADLGIADLCIAGVAKGPDRDAGREHFYVPDKPSFMLEARDPVLYYIQRLRDEAHRFAIGSHRAKRAKAIGAQSAGRDRRHRTDAAKRPCCRPSARPRRWRGPALPIWPRSKG